jgi:hypothetical protein
MKTCLVLCRILGSFQLFALGVGHIELSLKIGAFGFQNGALAIMRK